MPSKTTNDVNLYCTHSDLADELGGARKLRLLQPPDADQEDPTLLVREQALRDVLKSLARRTPPILETQLSDFTELKDAVCYGALMRLYRAAITADGDVHSALYNAFKKRFSEELQGLRVSVNSSNSVDTAGTSVWRG